MNDSIILIGDIKSIGNIMTSFSDINNYVAECYSYEIDEDLNFKEFSIKSLKKIKNIDNNIVLSTKKDYENEKDKVINYIGDSNVIYARDWLLYLLKNDKVTIRPSFVRMELSTICQLNCRDCYMRKSNYGAVGKGYLSFERFKEFIDKNKYIKRIEVSNSGEVFLNPDIEKILEYSYNNGIVITMNNGVNLNSVSSNILESIVKYKVLSMTISIDGASPDTYSYYRRNGNFNRVLDNIKKINEYKEKYNSKYPVLTWQFVVMNHNIDEVDKALELANKYNMKMFYKKDWSSNYDLDKIDRVSKIVGFDVTDKSLDYSGCRDLIFCPQINWDGRLLGCSFLYWDDWGSNVFEKDFIDTINNNHNYKYAIYRMLGDKIEDDSILPCGECKIRTINV